MEKITEILLEIKPDLDPTCTTLIDQGILDSFDIIALIGALSDAFDITIPATEIIPPNFNSVAALWALVQRLQEEG